MKFTFEMDHIGVAVESLEKGKSFWEAIGLGPMTTETVAAEKVNVGFFELNDGVRIELLEPTEKDSPIAKFLEKKGPGIQQICFRVEDIRATLKMLKSKGVQLINEEPRKGAHDCLVAFIHPKSTGGILIELSQRGAK
jgi:methylmalonyl-CoA/ethylmalonyl-CoA epimerase